MRAAVNLIALLSAAAGLQAVLLPTPSSAEEDRAGSGQEGGDRWVPSLALITGLAIQNWDGAVLGECTGCILDPSLPDPSLGASLLRDPDDDSNLSVTPFFGVNFELMTPELPIPSSPRLFVGADIAAAFGFERAVAREGDPGALACPLDELACESTRFNENAVLGQGSEVVATLDSVIYGIHAGIAFPFEFYGRALRVKPSFAWIRYGVDVEGLLVDAECRELPRARPNLPINTQCFNTFNRTTGALIEEGILREIRLPASASGSFNGVGPGLDFEMDTGRFGPLGTSLFVGARFYRILGNRKIELSASESFPQEFLMDGVTPADGLGPATTNARFNFEMDPWMYRVGIGLRFHWLGFDD